MSRPKVTIVGAGNVGATTAQRIGEAELADVLLIDIVEGMPQGKALDLSEAAPVLAAGAFFSGACDLAEMKNSDVIVMTAGLPRKPGMSRDDLLRRNAEIVGGAAEAIAHTRAMYEITASRNPAWTLPALEFAGTPTGIDVRKVVETGVAPTINTGIAHREAGVGQVGAGIVRAPLACFVQALEAFAAAVGAT